MEFAKSPSDMLHFYNSVRRAPVGHHHSKSVFKALFMDTDLNSSFISCGNAIKAHFQVQAALPPS